MTIEKELKDISWQNQYPTFKVIPGLESYAINPNGVVLALPKIRKGKLSCLNNMSCRTDASQRYYKAKIIKPVYKARYWYVHLMHKGIKKEYRVHRLVYLTFKGDIPQNMTIDHIDGNRDNNNISNLRCVTLRENCQNENTLRKQYKPIIMMDKNTGKEIREFTSQKEAMLYFNHPYIPGMSCHITDVCNHKRKTAYGYNWKWKTT